MSIIDAARHDKDRAWERLADAQREFDAASEFYSLVVRAALDGAAEPTRPATRRDAVKHLVSLLDTRLWTNSAGPLDTDIFDDVQLLMKLAVGHPLRPEDEHRLKARGKP